MKKMSAELHCHTIFSDGLATPRQCVERAFRKGIDVLAITDHDTAEGALPYWERQPEAGPLVIPGEEVTTDAGHVLAFFVRSTIRPGPIAAVLAEVRKQGALAFMAHPVRPPVAGSIRGMKTEYPDPEVVTMLDGLEVVNGRSSSAANSLNMEYSELCENLSGRAPLTRISGSDAHLLFEAHGQIVDSTTAKHLRGLLWEIVWGSL